MAKVPQPLPGDAMHPDGSGFWYAVFEVLIVCCLFIAIVHIFVRQMEFSPHLLLRLAPQEQAVGSVFLAGGLIQAALVVCLAFISNDMRRAIAGTFSLGNPASWGAALIAVTIHVATLSLVFIDEPVRITEYSYRNFVLSVLPASDGWSQEMIFRGYVIYRLARGGAPGVVQIAFSSLAFAAIHIGYAGPDIASTIWPIFGTAVLGGFFAWSVRLGRGALAPVVFAHIALIVVVQPWLALS